MDNKKLADKLLGSSNYPSLDKKLNSFVKTYIEKLIYDVISYVDEHIVVGTIEVLDNYRGRTELSQNITGIPSAYSSIDGTPDVLAQFAEQYSHLGIKEFDLLAKEAIIDFLNLHNGLFVVQLSSDNICELSLDVPKQNGNYNLDSAIYKSITVIPVVFTYGTVKFLLCES